MTPYIIQKLNELASKGINSEPEALYFLAQTRKLLERDGHKATYPWLNFHCNWALHSELSGTRTPEILSLFDKAHKIFVDSDADKILNCELKRELDEISNFRRLRTELSQFLTKYKIQNFTARNAHWVAFVKYYSQIIEDISLVIKASNKGSRIKSVTVETTHSNELHWVVTDTNNNKADWTIVCENFDI